MQKTFQKYRISYNYSMALKGIAVILMVLHHGLGLPGEWFEEGLGFGHIILGERNLYQVAGNPLKLCVSIFAFLTGYSYCIKRQYTFKYGIKKAWGLLTKYWFVLFFVFYPLGYFISGHIPGVKEIIFNTFSIHQRAVSFSWYVLFYVLCMCSLPLLVRLVTGKSPVDFVGLPILFTVVIWGLDRIVIQKWYLIADMRDYFYWMPIVWIGYLCAYYGVYETRKREVNKILCWIILWGIPVLRGMCSEILRMNMDVIYAPIFIFAFINIVNEGSKMCVFWEFFGRYSMYIWFLHALFFWDKTRSFFQPVAYGNKNIVLSMILLVTFSFAMAVAADSIIKGFSGIVKRREKH